MVILGLLLVLVTGVVTAGVVVSNTDTTTAEAFGVSLSNVSIGGLFLAGAVAGWLFGIGLALLVAGLRRKQRRQAQRRRVVAETRGTAENLQAENARLAARLEEERAAKDRALRASEAPRREERAVTRDQAGADRVVETESGAVSDSSFEPRGAHESDESPERKGLFRR